MQWHNALGAPILRPGMNLTEVNKRLDPEIARVPQNSNDLIGELVRSDEHINLGYCMRSFLCSSDCQEVLSIASI